MRVTYELLRNTDQAALHNGCGVATTVRSGSRTRQATRAIDSPARPPKMAPIDR